MDALNPGDLLAALLSELGDADIDSGYIQETFVDFVNSIGFCDEAAVFISTRFGDELAEWRRRNG